MSVVRLFMHGTYKTTRFLSPGCISQRLNTTHFVLPCSSTDDLGKRQYSALTTCEPKRQLLKSQKSTVCMVDSKRQIETEFNLFYMLIHAMECQFIFVKDTIGLDWLSTIVLCTLPYRLAMAVFVQATELKKQSANELFLEKKLEPLRRKEMDKFKKMHKDLSPYQRQKLFVKTMYQQNKKLMKEEQMNPFALIIYNFLPLPYWIANSLALRDLSGFSAWLIGETEVLRPDLATGGALWFQNLLEADPYHVLPIAVSASFILSSEVALLSSKDYGKVSQKFWLVKYLRRGVYFYSVIVLYFFWGCPSAMVWYWSTSGIMCLLSKLLLMHPAIVKRMASPNKHHTINPHPYRTIVKNMKHRYNPKNWFTD